MLAVVRAAIERFSAERIVRVFLETEHLRTSYSVFSATTRAARQAKWRGVGDVKPARRK
jgi:hypothetical protein